MTETRERISPNVIRQLLKGEIDTWPAELLVMTWEFTSFEKARMGLSSENDKAADLADFGKALDTIWASTASRTPLSDEEINSEIQAAREDIRARKASAYA
jgi:hypothetical protein